MACPWSPAVLPAVVGLAVLGLPEAPAARQPAERLAHFFHVATGFSGAPGGRGLAVTAAIEVNAAMRHANLAAGHPADLDAMKTHVRQVLQALAPAGNADGPGLGFGVGQAAEAIVTHIERAVQAAGVSGPIRARGPAVAAAARALRARAQAMTALGARVLAMTSAAEAAPLVEDLRTMALELDTGKDADGSGRIDLDAVEPGMNQLEAQLYAILEEEHLPRVLK